MRKLIALTFVLLGIFLFSYFIGATGFQKAFAIAGFLLSIVFIVGDCDSNASMQEKFYLKKSKWLYLVLGLLTGIAIGWIYRNSLELSILPETVTSFLIVAALIGASEELIFRGYLQNKFSEINAWMAIVAGALAHTIYKALLFVNPFVTQTVDVWFLVSWTFALGLVFGIYTKFAKSIWPALIAHSIFDVLVYGQLYNAPWWVW